MPTMLWSENVLRFAAAGKSNLAAQGLLERVAARLGSASLHAEGVRRPRTLVVVVDLPSRDCFITWAVSPPAASLSNVAWLVLNRVAHDPARAAAALREAVEVLAAAAVLVILPEPGLPDREERGQTREHLLSGLKLDLPVTFLWSTVDGYEEAGPDPLEQEPSDEALITTSGSGPAVICSMEVSCPDGPARDNASSVTEGALDLWDDLEAGPSPWRS
jgi:hypothetical protein